MFFGSGFAFKGSRKAQNVHPKRLGMGQNFIRCGIILVCIPVRYFSLVPTRTEQNSKHWSYLLLLYICIFCFVTFISWLTKSLDVLQSAHRSSLPTSKEKKHLEEKGQKQPQEKKKDKKRKKGGLYHSSSLKGYTLLPSY